jgi:hypothetical protein
MSSLPCEYKFKWLLQRQVMCYPNYKLFSVNSGGEDSWANLSIGSHPFRHNEGYFRLLKDNWVNQLTVRNMSNLVFEK